MGQPIKIYEPVPERKFERFQAVQNQLPGSARFHTHGGCTVLVFNSRLVQEAGLGSAYRSADLGWSEETSEMLLKLYQSRWRGVRRLSQTVKGRRASMAATLFLRHFGIRIREHVRYRAFQESPDEVVVDLASGERVSRGRQ